MKNSKTQQEELNIFNFIAKLRQEKLFIENEKIDIQDLNEKVKDKIHAVVKQSWFVNKRKLLLLHDSRGVGEEDETQCSSSNSSSSSNCNAQKKTLHFNYIENDHDNACNVDEAKNVLGFQNAIKIANLLNMLRTQPKQLAQWLSVGETIIASTRDDKNIRYSLLLESILNGFYGCCIFIEDTKFMLTLIYELAKEQLMKCDNPKNLIKQKSCAFSQLYYLFQDTYQPGYFFLSAALEVPILEVVSFSNHFLDIDHNKTIMRFRQDDNLNSYKDAVEYRNEIVSKLDYFIKTFIQSILDNVFCFPKAISWICFQIYKMVEQNVTAKEANAVIVELLFTTFLCPVIINPEQYGIIQSEISEMARHNLLQIAKILQILALEKYEGIDKKYVDIFIDIDKSSMNNFMEILFDDIMDCNDGPPIDSSPLISRDIMLFSVDELNNLIYFLQILHLIIRNENDTSPTTSTSTENNLSSLYVAILDVITNNSFSMPPPPPPSASSSSSSRDNSPKSTLLASSGSGGSGDIVIEYISSNNQPVKKSNSINFFSLNPSGSKNTSARATLDNQKSILPLSFPINRDIFEPIGLLSEEKVIDLSVPNKNESGIFEDSAEISDSKENLTLDNNNQTSTGYADEAISEAASNHSVGSSLELENEDQNDNLSDMVSANVSGRGTPNISGRDTPSSQVNENEDRLNVENQPENVPRPSQNLSRQIRSDIDDKFCKFEIKKLLQGDETFSIISDTWSTDVLASDNETLDLSDARNDRHQLQLVDQAIQEVPLENVLDISETRSESAWSTDVVTSDTERCLTEIDNDDASSIAAQSDDTNSVARSDDMRSETDESAAATAAAACARRLSTCSSSCNAVAQQQSYVASATVNSPIYVNLNSIFSPNTTATSAFVSTTTMSTFKPIEASGASNSNYVGSSGGLFRDSKLPDCKMNGKLNGEYGGRETPKNLSFPPPLPPQHQQKSSDGQQNVAGSAANVKNNLIEIDNDSKQNTNSIMKKYNDRSTDMLCSNSSLNSSASGSSNNSFENHNNKQSSRNENSDQWCEPKSWMNSSGSSLNATITPTESTVELSLLNSISNAATSSTRIVASTSTVNPIQGGGAIRKTTGQLKPSASTGAIPKSISFDTSVDKGLDDDSRSKRSGFFGKLKNGFRYKKRFRNNIDDLPSGSGGGGVSGGDVDDFSTIKKGGTHESPVKINLMNTDSSDDILAKYRAKPCCPENSPIKDSALTLKKNQNPIINVNADDINSFSDIKKKLRLALANTSEIPYFLKRKPGASIKAKLENILRLELAKRRRIKDWSFVGRISEALRCVKLLDEKSCLKLFDTMKTDIVLRSAYIQYLIDSKQQLLFYDTYLDSLKEQIERDRIYCEIYFATRFVRTFAAEQETIILRFCDEFKQLSLADEKHDFLQNFYRKLYACLNENRGWHDKQKRLIKMALERYIISRVYTNAIYPNGDGDRDRDKVLHDHIENLAKIITPSHKDLMIPKIYLRESPWLPAQAALRAMDASKTPKDKLKCILRCARSIMDLLALSQSGSGAAATADDFTPVLVYVIIKVNPEALLSTIQFINSFQGQINGEEAYWWTQFCSAVEYIKTMDY